MSDETEATAIGTENLALTRTGKKIRPVNISAPAMVWGDVLRLLGENHASATRNAISKDLGAVYHGNYEDDEEVTIVPTEKNVGPVLTELGSLFGETFNLEDIPLADGAGRTSTKKTKEASTCVHCGETTGGGRFRPGHDMKLRGQLTRVVENTSLGDTDTGSVGEGSAVRQVTVEEAIAELVGYGWYTEDELNERRQEAFNKLTRAAEAKEAAAKAKAEAKAKAAEAKAKAAEAKSEEVPAEAEAEEVAA